jgi:hypothetical protein
MAFLLSLASKPPVRRYGVLRALIQFISSESAPGDCCPNNDQQNPVFRMPHGTQILKQAPYTPRDRSADQKDKSQYG